MTDPSRTDAFRSRILFGAAYYAEYQPEPRTAEDLDLMREAGFSVIRVGESVWSTWEPRDGEFDLDWLQPVLDGAHERGISVILGTPTYAVPPWLQRAHPEIAAERPTGTRHPWGARQEVDYTHPAFLFHAERVIRRVIARYAEHPAVIGYQVDNEPGMLLFHNRHTFVRFVERLKDRYGDVETLNREWGLTYWSHRISDWAELWVPDGNTLPQYDLAWRRYQAELTTEYISWQAEIVREYARDDQFVTTCLAYPRPAMDDEAITTALDVTAGNPYYGMQDRLGFEAERDPISAWTTTGVWGLLRQADRMYSSRQERYLVTETNAGSISGSYHNYPPYPGQLRQAALALVARGAAMVEYWHWHSLHFGTETYWGGILPHSQRPGRIYREIAEIGATLRSIGDSLEGYVPDADVTLLFSNPSKWAMEFFPPLSEGDGPDASSYNRIFDAFYRGVVDAGRQARVLHDVQALALTAAQLAEQHPVLVVPALYVATDELLGLLRDYAEAGGHLVIGPRTGYGDEEARARRAVAPAILTASAGVWYDEFSNLDHDLALTADGDLRLSAGARGTAWADGLEADGATVLAAYDHPEFGRFAAITSRGSGAGRITTVGTVPNPVLSEDLARWLAPDPIASGWQQPASVTVLSGRAGATRAWFVHNWSSHPASVVAPATVRDLVTGAEHAPGTTLSLEPWTCLVLAEQEPRR
ncbi:beta-galactosidase [Planctomonas deserti]|uniref:beta-galactosidase n=1 Tax=Planctomonas deserti TaxID=2144185 RepID=UPI000D3BA328|nr:beta-galactosidase [Planctomonas deserti]